MKVAEEFVIAPPGRFSLNLRELWQYRELFYFFTWRDVKVKYKQTVLGIVWAILQPLLMMLIFTFFFGRPLHIETLGIPYPLFVFSGLVLWNLFSTGITNAGNSMVTNSNIIKKIYFPRLIIPVSSILSSLLDFCFAFLVMVGLLIWYHQPVNYGLALLYWPLGVFLACLATFGWPLPRQDSVICRHARVQLAGRTKKIPRKRPRQAKRANGVSPPWRFSSSWRPPSPPRLCGNIPTSKKQRD